MSIDLHENWQAEAKEGNLAGAIEKYVRSFDWVTFAELVRLLEPYAEVRGDLAIISPQDPNIIIWAGLSETFIDVLATLLRGHRICYAPASVLAYAIDGAISTLPVVKRPPKRGYKDLHWLPVCLRPGDDGVEVEG